MTDSSSPSSSSSPSPPSSPSSSSPPSVFFQIIDGDGNFSFTPHPSSSALFQTSTSLSMNGEEKSSPSPSPSPSVLPWSLVSIMGCQSSGKSTLLNRLFGTSFSMMSAAERQQTTKGCWMDMAHTSPPSSLLFILDVEGTDSGERGEDRTTFERQTALFALSLADVVILNMWEHDIGRYTASNYGILKTIFEVNLKIFHPEEKTNILIVIRDHIEGEGEATIHGLQGKIMKEITKIWHDMVKPESYSLTPLSELFTFHFFALPHLKLQKNEFENGVKELQKYFVDPTAEKYLFSPNGNSKKSVPLSGFSHYVSTVWETIKSNKELNLPSQREMLATFRCDEIIAELVAKMMPKIKDHIEKEISNHQNQKDTENKENKNDNNNNENVNEITPSSSSSSPSSTFSFSSLVRSSLSPLLSHYDHYCESYHVDIVSKKRQELLKKIGEILLPIFTQQIGGIMREMNEKFKNILQTKLRSTGNTGSMSLSSLSSSSSSSSPPDDIDDNFYVYVEEVQSAILSSFVSEFSLFSVGECEWPSVDTFLPDLTSSLLVSTDRFRSLQLNRLEMIFEMKIKWELNDKLSKIIGDADPSRLWTDIALLILQVRKTIRKYLNTKGESLRLTVDERSNYLSLADRKIHSIVRLFVSQQAATILLLMKSRFDRIFRYDSDGIKRVWKVNDNIRRVWMAAKEEAMQIMDTFQYFKLDFTMQRMEDDEKEKKKKDIMGNNPNSPTNLTPPPSSYIPSPDDILISPLQRLERESSFQLEVESALREAEADQERSKQSTKVPTWVIPLLIILGFDEIMTVLRNPLFIIIIAVGLAAYYGANQMGMMGPIKTVGKQFVAMAMEKIMAMSGEGKGNGQGMEKGQTQGQGQSQGEGKREEKTSGSSFSSPPPYSKDHENDENDGIRSRNTSNPTQMNSSSSSSLSSPPSSEKRRSKSKKTQ